jgi:hypothetical protein
MVNGGVGREAKIQVQILTLRKDLFLIYHIATQDFWEISMLLIVFCLFLLPYWHTWGYSPPCVSIGEECTHFQWSCGLGTQL